LKPSVYFGNQKYGGYMRALEITNPQVTPEALLKMAEIVPGAWVGIRIAGLLLILSGWRTSEVAKLFGLSRWSVVKWVRHSNQEGTAIVEDKARPGRPSRISKSCREDLAQALQKSPNDFGIQRARWDGIVVVEYLKRYHQVTIRVRRAQILLHELGFALKQPIYRYAQATKEGVEEFQKELKKTPGHSEEKNGRSHRI
jgi:transposase